MFLKLKGQSTAEYAILIALVAAVAAGFLSVGLKGAIRGKNQQASDYLMRAGTDASTGTDLLSGYGSDNRVPLYTQEVTKTQVKGGADYKNVTVLEKGGSEKKYTMQTTDSDAISVETLDSSLDTAGTGN
jgi:Flp pilus assembly pilin Flp